MRIKTRTFSMYTTTIFNQWSIEDAKNLSNGFTTETKRILALARDKESRRQGFARASRELGVVARELVTNVMESPVGHRGEWWFALQAAAIIAVIYGTFPLLGVVLKLSGLFSIICGCYYSFYGLLYMSESFSPFVYPVSKNILKTDGAYAIARHPMYTGLILMSFGLALSTASLGRFLLSIVLSGILVSLFYNFTSLHFTYVYFISLCFTQLHLAVYHTLLTYALPDFFSLKFIVVYFSSPFFFSL